MVGRFSVGLVISLTLLAPELARAQEPAASAPPQQTAPPPQQPAPPPQQPAPYPPPYPPPYYYPAPYPYPVYEPPPPWKSGDPVPSGYRVESKVDTKTIRSGVTGLALLWVVSVVAAAVLNNAEEPASEDGDDVEPGDWSVLYWPVAGPFLALRNVEDKEVGFGLLLLDGVFQSVGLIAIVVGLASSEEYLVPDRRAASRLRLQTRPLIGPGFAGAAISASF